MKKTIALLSVLLLLVAWYPLLVIVGWVKDFSVTLRYPLLSLRALTLAFSGIGFYLMFFKEKTINTVTSVLSGLLVPVSVAHLFAWTWESGSFWMLALSLVWVAFACLLVCAYSSRSFFQGAQMGGSAVVLFFALVICLIRCFFNIGTVTVVQTLPSPAGTYYAALIDDDQGALGGNAVVEVHDTRKKLDLFVLEISKNPQIVYFGDWGKFENMKLEWKSEQVLLINGAPHEIQ